MSAGVPVTVSDSASLRTHWLAKTSPRRSSPPFQLCMLAASAPSASDGQENRGEESHVRGLENLQNFNNSFTFWDVLLPGGFFFLAVLGHVKIPSGLWMGHGGGSSFSSWEPETAADSWPGIMVFSISPHLWAPSFSRHVWFQQTQVTWRPLLKPSMLLYHLLTSAIMKVWYIMILLWQITEITLKAVNLCANEVLF